LQEDGDFFDVAFDIKVSCDILSLMTYLEEVSKLLSSYISAIKHQINDSASG